jgi:hypothetical protein
LNQQFQTAAYLSHSHYYKELAASKHKRSALAIFCRHQFVPLHTERQPTRSKATSTQLHERSNPGQTFPRTTDELHQSRINRNFTATQASTTLVNITSLSTVTNHTRAQPVRNKTPQSRNKRTVSTIYSQPSEDKEVSANSLIQIRTRETETNLAKTLY